MKHYKTLAKNCCLICNGRRELHLVELIGKNPKARLLTLCASCATKLRSFVKKRY